MTSSFVFEAENRSGRGKGDARRLRRTNRVPAVIYGGHADPLHVSLDHNKVLKHLENDAVYSHILTVRVDGKEETAILKAMQRHPAKPMVTHIDFQRVSASDRVHVRVPLHFINESTSVGVKKGGVVTHSMVDVEVVCLPHQLPEAIEVDLAKVGLGEIVHLSDLKVPGGVQIVALTHGAEHDHPVVVIQHTPGSESESA
ncbi:50S ribosomal protein L25/general stress protein Ctc [Methylogaea oryzae]|uniref:Large ribosomal subunit protein bL25 n=1 Tax=Methylogaea oryzae TaxID=1295382 RepID=A0A8D5AH03_9GAMM|nr:50S ribosomal protein L25/general stress protein Ctc [Methylogaea oryzae]BBL69761.1 50S ribosomal protein L25 [Methylogaea oryzae]